MNNYIENIMHCFERVKSWWFFTLIDIQIYLYKWYNGKPRNLKTPFVLNVKEDDFDDFDDYKKELLKFLDFLNKAQSDSCDGLNCNCSFCDIKNEEEQ